MADTRKFYADVQRCLKRERAAAAVYDGKKASKAVAALFMSYAADMGDLPRSMADYWEEKYIETSSSTDREPTPEHVDWLANCLSFMDGTMDSNQDFSVEDWKNIRDFVNYEAEVLPLTELSAMMTTLVKKKVV